MNTDTPKPESRQRTWQRMMALAGKCINCGKINKGKTQRCETCRVAYNKYQREKKGHQPWRAGSVGRPPKQHLQ